MQVTLALHSVPEANHTGESHGCSDEQQCPVRPSFEPKHETTDGALIEVSEAGISKSGSQPAAPPRHPAQWMQASWMQFPVGSFVTVGHSSSWKRNLASTSQPRRVQHLSLCLRLVLPWLAIASYEKSNNQASHACNECRNPAWWCPWWFHHCYWAIRSTVHRLLLKRLSCDEIIQS